MKKIILIVLAAILFIMGGCSAKDAGGTQATGLLEVEGATLPDGQVSEQLINSNNSFATAMLNQLDDSWTGVFSPESLTMALELAMNGADETALTAMRQALKNEMPLEELNLNNARLIKTLNGSKGVSIANALFANNTCKMKDEFVKTAADYYRAGLGVLDFKDEKKTVKIMNDWISENTNGKIKDLIDGLSRDSEMMLINAVSLDLDWETEFEANSTSKASFNGIKKTTEADMMHMERLFEGYAETSDGQLLKLPYKNNEYYMLIALPKEGTAPKAFMSKLLQDGLGSIQFAEKNGTLALPKIDLETKLNMNDILKAMGMQDAFLGGNGQFSNLLVPANNLPVQISQVLHGASLQVDEKGTEAAAATAIEFATGSAPLEPKDTFHMECNRPFALSIIHQGTGAVLFVSIINDLD